MKNPTYVCLQSLGDNLISLYLLKQLDEKLTILGTTHTKTIANLIDCQHTIKVVFEDIPAFYHLRDKGIFNAIYDILKFRTYIKNYGINELVFEKYDFRIKLLTFGLSKYISKNTTQHAYLNRKNLIESTYNQSIFLKPSLKPNNHTKKILINPIAKMTQRNIQKSDLSIIIDILKMYSFEISIIDYSQNYNEYKLFVDHYYTGTNLEEAKNFILDTDFFIGTDSFLIHLAYYLDKSFFLVLNFDYFDFLPPNCEIINNYIITSHSNNFAFELRKKFNLLGLIP